MKKTLCHTFFAALLIFVFTNCGGVVAQNVQTESVPKPEKTELQSQYNKLITQGNILLEKKEFDNALKNFNEAIRLNPKSADGYIRRGLFYYRVKKDFDKATEDFKEALRLNPKSEPARRHYSEMHLYRCIEFYKKVENDFYEYPITEEYLSNADKELNKAKEIGWSKIPDKSFWAALSEQDIKSVRQWLDIDQTLINAKSREGNIPLIDAALYGKLEVVKYLVEEKHADVNTKSQYNGGITPIFWAARSCSLEFVKYLVEKGADVNMKNTRGETPLFGAARSGKLAVVKYLIESGADVNLCVNAQDNFGHNLFTAAVCGGNIEVVKYLISKGVDANIRDSHDINQVFAYGDEHSLELIRYLVEKKGISVNTKFRDGSTPLIHAAKSREPDIVKYLIGKGAGVNTKNEAGITPLMQAANNHSIKTVKYLIEKGADVDAKNKDGLTPLIQALKYPNLETANLETIKYLVEKGADVNAKNKDGLTPLFYARGELAILKYLVEKGADVNVKDKNGLTLLDSPLNAATQKFLRDVGGKSGKEL
ncbi:MAG: ankyrin repeat domain-containing protein [Planctomycetaceae bacterium]|nr:ankyrin repeat domain-containing protein [Planctomycetaceae bacterium]